LIIDGSDVGASVRDQYIARSSGRWPGTPGGRSTPDRRARAPGATGVRRPRGPAPVAAAGSDGRRGELPLARPGRRPSVAPTRVGRRRPPGCQDRPHGISGAGVALGAGGRHRAPCHPLPDAGRRPQPGARSGAATDASRTGRTGHRLATSGAHTPPTWPVAPAETHRPNTRSSGRVWPVGRRSDDQC